jgi:hypothetical protein
MLRPADMAAVLTAIFDPPVRLPDGAMRGWSTATGRDQVCTVAPGRPSTSTLRATQRQRLAGSGVRARHDGYHSVWQ